MTPTALSIITTTFQEGSERNKALGIWGSLGGIGATAAWLIGGPLVDGPGWGWIFFINVPLGIGALLLVPMLIRESRASTARRSFDPGGALTVSGGLFLLVYALVDAPDAGWSSARTILLFAGSAALLGIFTAIEARHSAPLLPLRILRSRTLVGANVAMLLFGATAFGMPFVLTLYAQQVLGFSAVKFGVTSVVFPRDGGDRVDPGPVDRAAGWLPAGRLRRDGADDRGLCPAHPGLRRTAPTSAISSLLWFSSGPGWASPS